MSENKNSRVPACRFPGFEGEWEEKKLGDVIKITKGKQVNGDKLNKTIGYPMMNGGATLSGYYTNYNCEANTIIISEGGNSCGFVNYMKERFWAGGHCYIVSTNNDDCAPYIYQMLKYNENRIMALRVGSGLPNIQSKSLVEFKVMLPPTLAEQQKIAECLTAADETIAAQQEKVDALKREKKGLMQQLFPQDGETTPRLRFPGFEGEWEEKSVDELCSTLTPPLKLQSSEYKNSGKYPIIDQSQAFICGWTDNEKGLITETPIIVFGDHTCVLKFIDFPFVQGADGVKILVPSGKYNARFVYQSFLANPVKQDGYKRHFTDFKEKTYPFPPSILEQQKIADCLSALDDKISAEQQKLEALKDHKKGLMQQLFPQPSK